MSLIFDADLIAALRTDLLALDYTVAGVSGRLGQVAAGALQREQAVPALRATAGADEDVTDNIGLLIRFFTLGQPVAAARLEDALPTVKLAGMLSLGLASYVDARGEAAASATENVKANVDVRPYSTGDAPSLDCDWFVVSDLGEVATNNALRTEHVLGVGGASVTLANATMREHVATTLDIGTGCGIQTLYAAQHSNRVIATDLSDRALAIAAFNMALNSIDNVELRHGSMLEPVAGERFDLIVSNPPFVITPRTETVPTYTYRDGGQRGDALVMSLLADLPNHLNPGGVAQILGNWELQEGQNTEDVLAGVIPADVDCWVIERERQDVSQYAATWIRDGGTDPRSPKYAELMDAWLEDFASRGVEYVAFGVITLRKPAVAGNVTLRRIERCANPIATNLGEHLRAGIAAWDAFTAATLSNLTLIVSADVREVRYLVPGQEDLEAIMLTQGAGFQRQVPIDTALAGFVGACHGDLSAGQIIHALSQILEIDLAELTAALTPAIGSLIQDGFLTIDA